MRGSRVWVMSKGAFKYTEKVIKCMEIRMVGESQAVKDSMVGGILDLL